ncbi:MAG: hypothetical protein PHU07_09110 [Acidocella sp.]|nr:hypothetical protein [Acidocella sp.]
MSTDTVMMAGLLGALMVAGVVNVVLRVPGLTADLLSTDIQAPYCTGISLSIGGIGVWPTAVGKGLSCQNRRGRIGWFDLFLFKIV